MYLHNSSVQTRTEDRNWNATSATMPDAFIFNTFMKDCLVNDSLCYDDAGQFAMLSHVASGSSSRYFSFFYI